MQEEKENQRIKEGKITDPGVNMEAIIPVPTSNQKIDVEKAIELRLKGLTYRDIAKVFNCTHGAVVRRISKLLPKIDTVDIFKQKRADILTAKQMEICQSLTGDKIKKSSAAQLATILGILYDKERLERGLSTENQAKLNLSLNIGVSRKNEDNSVPSQGDKPTTNIDQDNTTKPIDTHPNNTKED